MKNNILNAHLPVVDFCSPTAARDFCQSLHTTGFGVLHNHPLKQSMVQGIYDEWLKFFQSESKYQYLNQPPKHDGYFPPTISETAKNNTHKDLKEFYHIYTWGKYPNEVSNSANDYLKDANVLATTLLKWVEDESPNNIKLNYSIPLPQMLENSDSTLLRVLHYPPLSGDEEPDAVRAAPHGDINLLTILPAATEPGLQILSKDGNWYNAPSEFGLLIVNIGDMLEEASGGYYPSTIHRVLNPIGDARFKPRISLPLFLHPRRDIVLSDRYTVGSYFDERMRELRGGK